MGMKKGRNGFSMIELLIVIALIGLFAALGLNYSLRNKDRWTLRDTGREITSLFYQAKQRASTSNLPVRLDFSARTYGMSTLQGGAWTSVWSEDSPPTVTIAKTPNDNDGFAITPIGMIVHPDTRLPYGTQTIQLTSPRGNVNDLLTIVFFPYGGIRVSHQFN